MQIGASVPNKTGVEPTSQGFKAAQQPAAAGTPMELFTSQAHNFPNITQDY